MWTALYIQAGVRSPETLYRLIADDVGFDDLVYVSCANMAVPDRIGIDDYVRPMLALVQAAGFVGADGAFNPALRQLDLE